MIIFRSFAVGSASLLALAMPTLAHAALPDPVRAMIAAALADGKDADIEAVVRIAKQTNPDDAAEIEALVADHRKALAARQEAEAAEAKRKLASAGFFENWHGEGQLGAFLTTGNSDTSGASAGLALTRQGDKWRHNFSALADYQRSNGVTTTEQFAVQLEPQYQVSKRMFVYGLGRWERDRFQGYAARWTASGGVGYRVIDTSDLTLDVKGGPAWRKTRFIGGGSDSQLTALAAANLGWQITPSLRLTDGATVFAGQGNTSLTNTLALDAKLSGKLSARIAYVVDHDTNPPLGADSTDTLTRLTLVYGF